MSTSTRADSPHSSPGGLLAPPIARHLGAPLLACLLAISPVAADAELRVGLGTAALPAPAGGVLAGYAAPWDRRADGVLDAPEARALVLESEELRVGLVTLDVLIARPALRPVPNEDAPQAPQSGARSEGPRPERRAGGRLRPAGRRPAGGPPVRRDPQV